MCIKEKDDDHGDWLGSKYTQFTKPQLIIKVMACSKDGIWYYAAHCARAHLKPMQSFQWKLNHNVELSIWRETKSIEITTRLDFRTFKSTLQHDYHTEPAFSKQTTRHPKMDVIASIWNSAKSVGVAAEKRVTA
jgi:hypothetical protein